MLRRNNSHMLAVASNIPKIYPQTMQPSTFKTLQSLLVCHHIVSSKRIKWWVVFLEVQWIVNTGNMYLPSLFWRLKIKFAATTSWAFAWGNLSNRTTYYCTLETLKQNKFTPLNPLELLSSSSLSFVICSEREMCCFLLLSSPLQRLPDSKSEQLSKAPICLSHLCFASLKSCLLLLILSDQHASVGNYLIVLLHELETYISFKEWIS